MSENLPAMSLLKPKSGFALAICVALWTTSLQGRADEILFNRDIRPILSDNCFQCHGPDPKNRKGKMRLDVREEALAKKAFVPGDPANSELLARLVSTDAEEVMPPPETHKTVTAPQRELLRRWIAAGAAYEPHWSYAPVVRPAVPAVANARWPATPIDRFLLSRLDAAKIAPSPAADRRTLLRRLSLDLTGLPPTPSEMESFLKDSSSKAYERQVDRLMASPHFGERMAVPWLDAVRFADTVGYHGDQNQNVFPYRDYVIDSFNRNKPFDQFTLEQIAGDLLPNATPEQRTASGFNRLNMMTREGGAQPREYLTKYAGDRVRTVSTAWLGSTLACAECHDHKFDPFSQADFYTMAAFFDDVKQWGVYNDYNYTPNPELKGWSNDHPFPPELVVTNAYLQRREIRLRRQLDQLLAGVPSSTNRAAFDQWRKETAAFTERWQDGWQIALAPTVKLSVTNSKAKVSLLADGSLLVGGKLAAVEKFVASFGLQKSRIAALRLELLPHPDHKDSTLLEGKAFGEVRLSATLKAKDGKERKLKFADAQASSRIAAYSNGFEVTDVKGTWKIPAHTSKGTQTAIYLVDGPPEAEEGDLLSVTVESDDIGRFRVSTTPLASLDLMRSGADPALAKALGSSGLGRGTTRAALAAAYLLGTANDPASYERAKALLAEVRSLHGGTSPTLVTAVTTNLFPTRVLPRGNWQDESQPILKPATPHFLAGPKQPADGRLSRVDLGRWLTSRDNPLTSRAYMNRLWKQFFGNGISNQPEELGAQGEPPTHPELMDWLAAEFTDSGWNVKHMVRLLVTSTAYQQDSKGRPELRDIDPNNRLLARQNPRRLEAEFVRANALFVAGLLDPEVGGPSAFPYQPGGYYVNIQFPDRDYYASRDERQYRRGLYSHWQRTFLHPMLANFDAPSREECAVDRLVSNTPQQALTLLNDPSFVEAAKVFAEKLLTNQKSKSDEARLDLAFQTVLLRSIKPAERASLLKLLADQRKAFDAAPDDATKLLKTGLTPPNLKLNAIEHASWTSVARVILNLHETITRY